jgi:hypothetical protein
LVMSWKNCGRMSGASETVTGQAVGTIRRVGTSCGEVSGDRSEVGEKQSSW